VRPRQDSERSQSVGLTHLAGAEPLYRRALAIDEKALGPEHPSTAISLNNLGSLLKARGDLAGAEPLYRRALAIDEKALGPDHPYTAVDLDNLAGSLEAKGDLASAETFLRRAVVIYERVLGPQHNRTQDAKTREGWLRSGHAVAPSWQIPRDDHLEARPLRQAGVGRPLGQSR
jgi:tetratricopeptide (TPR) repeat protein